MEREYEIDEVVKCRSQGQFYDAKIISIDPRLGLQKYKVHFVGWNSRHDKWVEANEMRPKVALPRPFTKICPRRDEEKNGEKLITEKSVLSPSLFPSHAYPSPTSSLGDSPSSSRSPQHRGARIEWTMRPGELFHSPVSMDAGPSSVSSIKKGISSSMSQELISQMASSRIDTTMTKEDSDKQFNGQHFLSDYDREKDHEAIQNSLMKRKHNGNNEANNKRKVVELVVGKNCDTQKQPLNDEQTQESLGEEINRGPQSSQSGTDESSPAQINFQVSKSPETREQINEKRMDKSSPKISELESSSPRASSSALKSSEKNATREEYRKKATSISSLEDLNTDVEEKSRSANNEERRGSEEVVSPINIMLSFVNDFNPPSMDPINENHLESLFHDLRDAGNLYDRQNNVMSQMSQDSQRGISNETFNAQAAAGSQPQERHHLPDFCPVGVRNLETGTPQSSTSFVSLPEPTLITSFTPETARSLSNAVIIDYGGELSAMPEMMTSYETACSSMGPAGQEYGYLPIGLNQVPAGMILEQMVVDSADPMNSQQAMIMSEPAIDFSQPQAQNIQLTLPPGVHPSQVSLGPGMSLAPGPQGQHYVLSDPIPSMAPPPTPVRRVMHPPVSSSTDHPSTHPSVLSSQNHPSFRPSVPVATSMSTNQQQRVLSREDHSYGLNIPNNSGPSAFSSATRREEPFRPVPLRPLVQQVQPSNIPFFQRCTPVNQEINICYQSQRGQIIPRRAYLIAPQQPHLQYPYEQVNLAYPVQRVKPVTYYQMARPINRQVQPVNENRSMMGLSSLVSQAPRMTTQVQPSFDYHTPVFERTLVPVTPQRQQGVFNQQMMPGPSNGMPTEPSDTFMAPISRPATAQSVPSNILPQQPEPQLVNKMNPSNR
ncbi:unnamed protein product, partial [Mesorhabditis belari]|uniref:Tudor-knot domain-containing protein n=1 Tax=Mesorhabditis belari TaxID=2138241 RepID=A0AAF3F0G5_9BILA